MTHAEAKADRSQPNCSAHAVHMSTFVVHGPVGTVRHFLNLDACIMGKTSEEVGCEEQRHSGLF